MVADKLNAPERCVLLKLGLAGVTLAEDIQTRQNLPWRLKLLRTYEHDFEQLSFVLDSNFFK